MRHDKENILVKERRGVRLTDIAAEAGVSRVTVSKVLFPDGLNNTRVAEETAKRIRSIAKRLKYTPNLNAKQLAGEKSHLLGVLIDSFAPKTSYKELAYLERAAALQGYRLIVGQMHDEVEPIDHYLKDFVGRGVEGFICMAHDYSTLQNHTIESLYRPLANVVFVGEPVVDWADWVGADLVQGIRDVVSHLVQTGRRRIALLLMEDKSAACKARIRGFHEGIAQMKLEASHCPVWVSPEDPFLEMDNRNSTIMQESLARLLKQYQLEAIIAVNDLVAMYLTRSLQMHGILVPKQIAVVGFDNLEIASTAYPSITSVDQCPQAVAEKVIELALSRIEMPDRSPQKFFVKPELVLRESTL